jgi:hypothetical protein
MPLKTPFGLLIDFIHDLQFVTTVTYYTIPRLRYLQALHTKLVSLPSVVCTYLSYESHISLLIHSVRLHWSTSQLSNTITDYHCTIAHAES